MKDKIGDIYNLWSLFVYIYSFFESQFVCRE